MKQNYLFLFFCFEMALSRHNWQKTHMKLDKQKSFLKYSNIQGMQYVLIYLHNTVECVHTCPTVRWDNG
jgi:hypothetical protein